MPAVPRIQDFSLNFLRKLLKDPISLLAQLHERYGEICHIDKYGRDFYFCYSPEMAEHVLFRNQDNYAKVEGYKTYFPLFGENCLFVTNDQAQWHHDRKLTESVLDLKAHSADYVRVITDKCIALIDGIQGLCGGQSEPVSIPIADEINKLLFDIVQETLFYKLDVDREIMLEVKDEVHNLIAEKAASLDLLWLLNNKGRRYRDLLGYMTEARTRILRSRLNSGIDFDDMLGAFLHAYKITDEDSPDFEAVSKQMLMLNIIGQQEAITGLLWAVVRLAQHPEAAERIAAEFSSVVNGDSPSFEDYANLKYTHAFISEVLRLHPPLFLINREAIADDEVLGYPIPAKATVGFPLCRIHRHPGFWDDPDALIPERFQDNPWGQDNQFAYIPFLAGKRNCVGRNFVFLAMTLVTGMLAQRFRFSLPADLMLARDQEFLVYDRPNLADCLMQARG
jgi:cytochrome P450